MTDDSTLRQEAPDANRLAFLRHQHRNQIQNMTSLVGLFGRQLPKGECKRRFSELQSRFVALAHVSTVREDTGDTGDVDLAELAIRLIETLDPARNHKVALVDAPWPVKGPEADSLCQLFSELVIALFRQALEGAEPRSADLCVSLTEDGVLVMRAAAKAGAAAARREEDLGWSIAEGVARNLGGAVYRLSEAPLTLEARLPGTVAGR